MVKYIIILCLVLLSVVGQAESIHFRVISKIKQVDLKDVGGKIEGKGQQISIDGDQLTFSGYNKAFKISEQLYEDSGQDSYYSFVFMDHRRKFYTTILFSDEKVVIVITDENGIGWLYYVEVI